MTIQELIKARNLDFFVGTAGELAGAELSLIISSAKNLPNQQLIENTLIIQMLVGASLLTFAALRHIQMEKQLKIIN